MNALRQVFEVARRDFLQRARSKAFLIMTVVIVGAIFGLAPILASDIGDPSPTSIGVTGVVPVGFGDRLAVISESMDFETEVQSFESLDAGEEALESGDVDALLVDGVTLEFATQRNTRISGSVDLTVQSIERDAALAELGMTAAEASAILAPSGIEEQILSPIDVEEMPRRVGAYIGSILLYMAILIFGQFIMLGVMQEKQSRVVEVVLSRVRAEWLLTGKILGIGLLGLLQLTVIGGAIVGALVIVGLPGVDLSMLGASILIQTILWFLLGFAVYSVLYGALGATVTRQEDSQGAAMLPVILLLPGYLIAMTAIESPHSLAAVIGSFFPFTAPMVMPVRAATGTLPMWQILVSIGLVVVTTIFVIKLGARIYRGAVLSIGAKVKIRDALRSSGPKAA